MSIKALAEYTRVSKYSRYLPEKKRRETWEEQINRVFEMHRQFYGDETIKKIEEDFEFAKRMMLKKRILGSQRALQFGGDPILKKNERIYNCSASYIDRPRVFQEAMFLLLCGTGFGFSVQKHHVDKLPKIKKPIGEKKSYIIPDSIEGWADACGVLLSSYFTKNQIFPEFADTIVEFDYSKIRPKGAALSSGAKAPGPDGLRSSLEKVRELLDKIPESRKLRPIECYDILMHLSNAVLSGGVRRSATICLFSFDDEEMIKAKVGDWMVKNPQRARSNNSVVLIREKTTKEMFSAIMENVKQFGEPGFVFMDDVEALVNPCLTEDAWIMTSEGPRQIKSLIGKGFNALLNGWNYGCKSKGFIKTGNREVFSIVTNAGYEIEATSNHKFKVVRGKKEEWVEVKDLERGDILVLSDQTNSVWGGEGTQQEGWLLGSLYGDGNICNGNAYLDYWGSNREELMEHAIEQIYSTSLNTYQNIRGGDQIASVGKKRVGSVGLFRLAERYGLWDGEKKVVSSSLEEKSREFTIGFLRGWFDADGSVQGNLLKGSSIRLSSIDLPALKAAQRMLLRLGIKSVLSKNRNEEGFRKLPDGKGGLKEYFCQTNHELIISNDAMIRYQNIIGFADKSKSLKLLDIISSYKRTPNQTKFITPISFIRPVGFKDVYDCTIDEVHCFDANGLMSHNCCEIGLYAYDEKGNSGISFCNLSEINMKKCTEEKDFFDACKAASIVGTLQAGYTKFPYLGEVTERIVKREALIGVSMTGMMDQPEIAFDPETQRIGARLVKATNEKISKILGINPAARLTCVKPSGTSSAILGSSSGIHPHHARRYFRRVQANKLEEPVRFFKKLNPSAVEQSVWKDGDYVINFLCEIEPSARMKNDLSAVDMLEKVKTTQMNWVKSGTVKSRCMKEWLNHNVSNTIVVRENEWDMVIDFIWKNKDYFCGISLLPASGDKDYPQAPFCAILNEKEISQTYGEGSLFASGLIERALDAFGGNLWKACDYLLGLNGIPIKTDEMYNFKEKSQQFANRYCGGEIKKLCYLMKDVYLWKRWLDLKREYKDVDWEKFHEEDDNVDFQEEGACSGPGGTCLLGDLGSRIKEKQDAEKISKKAHTDTK